jgi:ribosomal protein S18 acetylase RimI-like enzyme
MFWFAGLLASATRIGHSGRVAIIRPATAEDLPFLEQMLAVAADWFSDTPRSVSEIISDPAVAHYIAGWQREDDVGVVAAEQTLKLGAAWWRFFTADDAGYGFVDASIPELSVAVVKSARRRGIGQQLLGALVEHAKARALPALSLSVAPDNHAVSLYKRVGFEQVGTVGESLTMLLRLPPRAVCEGRQKVVESRLPTD